MEMLASSPRRALSRRMERCALALSDVMTSDDFPLGSPCLDSSWLSLVASNLKKPFSEAFELK